jgi:hypothetical protein
MRSLIFSLLAPLCACGTTPPPDTTTPPDATAPIDGVATLDVTIEGDGSIDPQDVQLAIMWFRDRRVWPERQLEPQELLIKSHSLSWPLHVEAVIEQMPTYDPFYSSPTVGARPGRLVAYVDGDNNGRLDFTSITADSFTDRLIAYTPGTTINHYSTVDVLAQNIHVQNMISEADISTPMTLLERDELPQSCNLLEDWRTRDAYWRVFRWPSADPNDIAWGPWDYEAEGDSPCPGNMIPPLTTAVSCDGHALESTTPSAFIATTCGGIIRVCQFTPWMAPGNCTCDSTKYYCTDYEGGL